MTDTAPLTLTADQVRPIVNHHGIEFLLVPDEIAERMETERRDGWEEAHGFAWGQSRVFEPGTWMHDTLCTLMTAYAVSDIPAEFVSRDREIAVQLRGWASKGWELRPGVVGEGDWNDDTRTWIDFPNHSHLHPFGSAMQHWNGTGYRLAG